MLSDTCVFQADMIPSGWGGRQGLQEASGQREKEEGGPKADEETPNHILGGEVRNSNFWA